MSTSDSNKVDYLVNLHLGILLKMKSSVEHSQPNLARKMFNVTDRIDVSCDRQTFSPLDQKVWYDNRWTCESTHHQMEFRWRGNRKFKFKFM